MSDDSQTSQAEVVLVNAAPADTELAQAARQRRRHWPGAAEVKGFAFNAAANLRQAIDIEPADVACPAGRGIGKEVNHLDFRIAGGDENKLLFIRMQRVREATEGAMNQRPIAWADLADLRGEIAALTPSETNHYYWRIDPCGGTRAFCNIAQHFNLRYCLRLREFCGRR